MLRFKYASAHVLQEDAYHVEAREGHATYPCIDTVLAKDMHARELNRYFVIL